MCSGACHYVLEPYCIVVRGRRNQLAVWREGDGLGGRRPFFDRVEVSLFLCRATHSLPLP